MRFDLWFPGILCVLLSNASAAEPGLRFDGPANCGECHRPMHETWTRTSHFETWFSMHRMRSARRIADRLEVDRIKQSETCARCHYTNQPAAGGEVSAMAGVSCESCHGPAEKWNAVHADPTDPDAMKKAEALGMIRPGNVVGMVEQCYSCHTVNDEELIDRGGHNFGGGFEVVAWLEGEVRHNFIRSKGVRNDPTPPARKRLFHVVGHITALERAIREYADARNEGEFAKKRIKRRDAALERLAKIEERLELDVLSRILELGKGAPLTPGRKGELRKTADTIAGLKRQFAEENDGTKLAAVDDLLPGPGKQIGEVFRP